MRLRASLLAVLMAAAPLAMQGVVPRIKTSGDPPDPTILTSNSFMFGADALGGGVLSFQNETGNGWESLSVTVNLPFQTAIDCIPGPFVTCTVTPEFSSTTAELKTGAASASFLYEIFFGPAGYIAVPNGHLFSINLNTEGNDPGGAGAWPAGQDFSAQANAPEPAAGALAAIGTLALAVAGFYRRRSRVCENSLLSASNPGD